MNQYLIQLTARRPEMLTAGPTQQEAAALTAHMEYLQSLAEEGVVILFGRTQTSSADALGLVIVEAADDEAAERVMKPDPAVFSGVMAARLTPFRIAGSRAQL